MNEIDNRENLVDEKTVWEFLKFSNSYAGLTGMPFTPDLINQRMRDITLTRGVGGVTETQVSDALANPSNSEQELLRISESFHISSSLYRRLLDYMGSLLAFDFTYYCRNLDDPKEYTSRAYKKDLKVLREFLDNFDYKKEFGSVTRQLLREEAFFGILREDFDGYTLQQLPSDYCRIDGRFNKGLMFSFNYNWFLQGGVDIDMYPEIFKKTYNKLFDNGGNKYNPSITIRDRGNSIFVYWADCSPNDGFWSWKMTPEIIARIPYFAGIFGDLALQNLIRGLQKNSYMAQAAKLIIGEIPLLSGTQSTSLRDALAISPDLLGNFMSLMRSAVNSEAVKIGSAPLKDVKGFEFEGNDDIYSSFLRTAVGTSGINSNLLYSGDTKPNLMETQLSSEVDFLVMNFLYPSFANFIEFFVNKKTTKYKFGITFEGMNFHYDRDKRLSTQTGLMSQGIVNYQKIAAAVGQNPFVFQRQLEETKAMGWVDKLTPIIPGSQMSNQNNERGRPQKKETELSETGSETRETGSNEEKST